MVKTAKFTVYEKFFQKQRRKIPIKTQQPKFV